MLFLGICDVWGLNLFLGMRQQVMCNMTKVTTEQKNRSVFIMGLIACKKQSYLPYKRIICA